MATKIKLRRDTTSNWINQNPILANGELAYDTDKKEIRVGDGVNRYNDLPVVSKDIDSLAEKDLSNVSDTDFLNKIKNVDGDGSGIDADLLDGLNSSSFLRTDATSLPDADNVYNIGDSSHRFANIYAVNFQGKATSAKYADLAEKYTVKGDPKIGDVIVISENKDVDCEVSNKIASQNVLGVISENPAFKMNSELESGYYIALKGRVKCKVQGPVRKGEPLVSYFSGCAVGINNCVVINNDKQNIPGIIFGKALESIENEEVELIEIVVL